MAKPKLSRAQQEAFDIIVKDTNNGKSWMNPINLPHWVKNQHQVCQILERKGLLESAWVSSGTCYRPIISTH